MTDQFSFDDREDLIELAPHWEGVLETMADRLPSTAMEKFLRTLRPAQFANDIAIIDAPGAFVLEWVMDKYLETLQDELSQSFGRRIRIDLRVQTREKPDADPLPVSTAPKLAPMPENPAFRPNEKQRFDTFVVGPSSRLAFAGCNAVAEAPGLKYNPLFIYGPAGVGKTHLLHSIANRIQERDPRITVACVSAQKFTEDFVAALQNNRIEAFRRQHRSVGVWLLDDVQFIANRDRTQEEIFHTFNYLHSLGKQIVLCSDRPPRDLLIMEERLRSRFECGLVCDIQLPDTETRCAIVLKKAEQEGVSLDSGVAMVVAEGVSGSVRHLEGALNKLLAHSSIYGGEISISLAHEIVEKYYRSQGTPKPSFDQIVTTVARHFRIDRTEIKGISRKAPIAHARHVAIYVVREITGDSWKHIGALFGNRDHTSMMHGYKKIRDLMTRDRELSASVKMLIRDLYPEG